jgi:hypothetical protein
VPFGLGIPALFGICPHNPSLGFLNKDELRCAVWLGHPRVIPGYWAVDACSGKHFDRMLESRSATEDEEAVTAGRILRLRAEQRARVTRLEPLKRRRYSGLAA